MSSAIITEVCLGEVVDFLDSRRKPVRESDRIPGPYPYYGANGQQGTINDFLFDEPLVLLAEDGGHFFEPSRGIAYKVTGKTWVNNHAHVLQPRSSLDINYLCYVLRNKDVTKYLTGSTRAKLTKAGAERISIPLPPLPEQKRIAAILDKADELRAKRREAMAELDKMVQATFLDMFGDPVTNPKGWETKSLGNVCDVRDGTHDSPKYVNDGYPLLTSKNFKSGYIDLEGANLISEADYEAINRRSKVELGDLVMPMIGTIGNPVLVSQEPDFAIKNVALIKFGHNSPNNQYVKSLLCSHYFDHVTSKLNRGGTQKFVALKDLRGMSIPVPPDAEQKRYAAIVDSIESHRNVLARYLSDLNELFDSLQSRAFNGDL